MAENIEKMIAGGSKTPIGSASSALKSIIDRYDSSNDSDDDFEEDPTMRRIYNGDLSRGLANAAESTPQIFNVATPPVTPTRGTIDCEMAGPSRALTQTSPLGDELGRRLNRFVYLITYSKANLDNFPSQSVFAQAVLHVIRELELPLFRWVASKEKHQDGTFHYHMAIHLAERRKWKQIKNMLFDEYGIVCHFSDKTCGWPKAWRYVTKCAPPNWITESSQNTDLTSFRSTAPRTQSCMDANANKGKATTKRKREQKAIKAANAAASKNADGGGKKKSQDLRHKDVVQVIVNKRVGSYELLQGLAESRRRCDEWDLFTYMSVNTRQKIEDMILRVWDTMKAPESLSQVKLPRIAMLRNAKSGDCVAGCEGKWERMAHEIISLNPLVNGVVLRKAILDNIEMGRCKGANVFLVGPKDCGKSFLLLPLEKLFKVFSSPTSGRYNWMGIDEAEVIFLNDFRWDKGVIEWSDFLRLLSGERLWFERPKNLFATNYLLDENNTIPIFGTGKGKTQWRGSYQAADKAEDDMLDCRVKYFEFTYSIPEDKVVRRGAPSCPRCFAAFLLA